MAVYLHGSLLNFKWSQHWVILAPPNSEEKLLLAGSLNLQAGKMKQILHSDWLPGGQDWPILLTQYFPHWSCKKNSVFRHIINPVLTKLVGSRWLNIGHYIIQPSGPHAWSMKHIYNLLIIYLSSGDFQK